MGEQVYWAVMNRNGALAHTVSSYRKSAINKAFEFMPAHLYKKPRDMTKAERDAAWRLMKTRYGMRLCKVVIREIAND